MNITDVRLDRRQLLQRAGLGAIALTVPAVATACGGGSSSGAQQLDTTQKQVKVTDAAIDHLTWSVGAAPPTLDITTGFIISGITVQVLALEGLVTLDDELALKPLLAESWSQPDPLHYVYKLRPNVTFWDGTPMTAGDVAYSLSRHTDPAVASEIGTYYVNVKSVDVTGKDEVTVTMKRPDPAFQYVPVFSFVIPKALARRLGKNLGAPGSTVTTMGTGPYTITSFDANAGVTLVRNERYWGEKPSVRRAAIKFIANPETELLAMRSGGIQGQFEFPVTQAKDWGQVQQTSTDYAPPMKVIYLSFDLSSSPWNDLHLRRAVAHACNRQGYIDAFLAGHGLVENAIVAPGYWVNLLDADKVQSMYAKLPAYDYDLDRAKAELKQSAHAGGFSASIEYPNTSPEIGNALVSLSETLKHLNINLAVHEVTQNQWLANIYGHSDLGLLLMMLGPAYPDPANVPSIVYPSANAVKNNFNTANFKNARVDELLQRQQNTTNKTVRAQALNQVLQISGQLLPYFPLWFESSSMAIDEKYALQPFTSLYYYQPWLSKVRARA